MDPNDLVVFKILAPEVNIAGSMGFMLYFSVMILTCLKTLIKERFNYKQPALNHVFVHTLMKEIL